MIFFECKFCTMRTFERLSFLSKKKNKQTTNKQKQQHIFKREKQKQYYKIFYAQHSLQFIFLFCILR